MLKINESGILIYYYDFEKKFTSNIKIPSYGLCGDEIEVKLIHRSIWIVKEGYWYLRSLVHVFII